MIGEPPSDLGGVHETLSAELEADTNTFVGGPGTLVVSVRTLACALGLRKPTVEIAQTIGRNHRQNFTPPPLDHAGTALPDPSSGTLVPRGQGFQFAELNHVRVHAL